MASPGTFWQQLSADISARVDDAASGIVHIDVPAGRPATGLHIGRDLVVAADHAVAVDDGLRLVLEQGRAEAVVVGRDPVRDLVVLRGGGMPGAPLVLAEEAPRLGAIVVGAWRDWRGHLSVAASLVAGLPGPVRLGRGTSLEGLIQTRLLPARGLSGGALLDARGLVVGLLGAGLVRGTVVALPAPALRAAVEELEAHGRIRRGYLGVALQRVRLPPGQRLDERQRTALLVVGVEEESPAAHAGVCVGDLITACEGAWLADIDQLQDVLRADRLGQPIRLDLVRGGSVLQIAVTVGERDAA